MGLRQSLCSLTHPLVFSDKPDLSPEAIQWELIMEAPGSPLAQRTPKVVNSHRCSKKWEEPWWSPSNDSSVKEYPVSPRTNLINISKCVSYWYLFLQVKNWRWLQSMWRGHQGACRTLVVSCSLIEFTASDIWGEHVVILSGGSQINFSISTKWGVMY